MGRGKRQVVRRFHPSRSSANSLTSFAVTPARPQISSSWVSHLVLGRPTGRLPSGTASYTIRGSRSGAILSTWPYQRIWDFSTERSSGSTPRSVRMSTFLMRSIRVTPTIRLRNLGRLHSRSCSFSQKLETSSSWLILTSLRATVAATPGNSVNTNGE